MKAKFVGGPYDGMEIDPNQLNKAAVTGGGLILPISSDLGSRMFVLMPPREIWDSIMKGENVAVPSRYDPYERKFSSEGTVFEACPEGAIEQAQRESRLKISPLAHNILSALSDTDRHAVISLVSSLDLNDFSLLPHRVLRLNSDRPVYTLQPTEKLRAFVRILDSGEIELLDIIPEETLRLFLEQSRTGSAVG
jgi:hypothetical protein